MHVVIVSGPDTAVPGTASDGYYKILRESIACATPFEVTYPASMSWYACDMNNAEQVKQQLRVEKGENTAFLQLPQGPQLNQDLDWKTNIMKSAFTNFDLR